MSRVYGVPAFLPLTVAASATVPGTDITDYPPSRAVHTAANAAELAAAECWVALLAACTTPGRVELPARLRALSTALSGYTGRAWWFSDGSAHRRRVDYAQLRIEEAIRAGDGEEYAEAFGGYDHAVATAVVCAPCATTALAVVPLTRPPGDEQSAIRTR